MIDTPAIEKLLGELEEYRKDWRDRAGDVQPVLDAITTIRALMEAVEKAQARCRSYAAALTPSADTKAAYIGEVVDPYTYVDDFGDEITVNRMVSWDATKQIMAMIIGQAGMIEIGAIRSKGDA